MLGQIFFSLLSPHDALLWIKSTILYIYNKEYLWVVDEAVDNYGVMKVRFYIWPLGGKDCISSFPSALSSCVVIGKISMFTAEDDLILHYFEMIESQVYWIMPKCIDVSDINP